MRRKCLKVHRPFTFLSLSPSDLATLMAFGFGAWQLASRLVSHSGIRILLAGALFLLGYQLYFRLKQHLPPRFLLNALRWHAKPDLLLITRDLEPLPLVVNLEVFE